MSFILDALKKSELERQRQTMPGLVDSGAARARARLPVWAIALGLLLAVNLIVLSVVLLRGTPGTPGAPRTPPRDAATPPMSVAAAAGGGSGASRAAPPKAAAPADGPFSPLDANPVYAPEIPVATPPAGSSAEPADATHAPRAQTDGSDAGTERHARRREPLLSDDATQARDAAQARDEEALPTINELSLTGAQTLPELHLDVHVYATNAAERFVYINMRRYHEGATLEEGPTLERIRRDGVVLDYQGLRFLLPRQ